MDNSATLLIGGGVAAIGLAGLLYIMQSRGGGDAGGVGKGSKKKAGQSDKPTFPGGKMSIYFGSQTGTAEGFARTLMEAGREHGFDASTVDLEDFDPEQLKEAPLALFLMATYGEGEPTDNATSFTSWLKNEEGELPPDTLSNTQFSVFGLGNTQYEHYNRQGKLTNKNLELLGATRCFTYGEGDDDGTLEEDFENWCENLWPAMVAKFNPDAEGAGHSCAKKVSLDFVTKGVSGGRPKRPPSSQINSSTKHFFTSVSAAVVANTELRSGKPAHGSTRHIEIDINKTGLKYETADNLAVLPQNGSDVVKTFGAHMGYDLNAVVICEASQSASKPFKHLFPTPCTVEDILTKYLDIQGHVRHGSAHHLLAYVQDDNERDWLEGLLSKENRAQFKASVEDAALGFTGLLSSRGPLSSAKIPLDDLLHIVPFLQPRYYTISSSSRKHPTTVHITVSVTEYPVPGSNRVFKGVCSSYLRDLVPHCDNCSVLVRPSSFRLPQSLDVPIVMVGPGTGLAPMRALLQEREARGKQGQAGKNTLFFGCRRADEDYIYRNELEAYEASGSLHKLHLAFSRETKKKVYVQHLLANPLHSAAVSSDVSEGGYIYVCGATQMGTDVMEAFVEMCMREYYMSHDQAVKFVKDLQKNGRYVQELWTA